jgi:hypothetical protein
VLRLLARGMSNREIAARLVVSRKTVDNHVQAIYAKGEVSTRPAATVLAMRYRLLDPLARWHAGPPTAAMAAGRAAPKIGDLPHVTSIGRLEYLGIEGPAGGPADDERRHAMPKVELDLETNLAPEQVRAALLDFTPRRPQIWPGITASLYEVYRVEQTSADIKEGTKMPGGEFWAKEHYDWSSPGLITWTVRESNFCAPGSSVSASISPRDGGGSVIHVVWNRTPTTFLGRMAARMIVWTKGRPVRSSFERGMRNVARELGAA